MELNDALIPFLPAGTSAQKGYLDVPSRLRVALVSERLDLKVAIQQVLPTPRYALAHVFSANLIEKAMKRRICDVAIIDIDRKDEWQDSVFYRFDEVAADFPVIILCKKRPEIPRYLWKAQHVTDIVPYEAIGDPRFINIIEAAVLRTELIRDVGILNRSVGAN